MARIGDIARIVRSKNAGPFTITIDIIFEDAECAWKVYKALDREVIANRYNVDPGAVEILYYKPARAVKINIPRLVPSGHPGDTDVYGAQQHAPILELDVGVECIGGEGPSHPGYQSG